MTKKILLVSKISVASIVIAVIFFVAVGIVTPYEQTIGTLINLEVRIAKHLKENTAVPKNLSELPKRKGYRNSIRDGWLRKIEYTHQVDGLYVLKSYGRDGKLGGADRNSDITLSFKIDAGEIAYEILKVGDKIVYEQGKIKGSKRIKE